MLKFKEGVKGFIFDSSNGEVYNVFYKALSADESTLITEVISDDSCLFEDEEVVNDVFTVDCEEDLLDEPLSRVLDWID